MEKELVSIITPVYNCEKYIAETIESVINQSYKNWEMIIVDDVSSDNSCNIIEKYTKIDNRIKLVKLDKNSGAAKARNVAMSLAQGKFLAFLDSDDIWKNRKLEIQIRFMKDNDYAFTFTDYDVIDDLGRSLNKRIIVPKKMTYDQYLKNTIIQTVTVMVDIEKVGRFEMPPLKRRQDFVTWLYILKNGNDAYGLNESLAMYRRANNSLSSNKLKTIRYNWHVYRKIEKLSLFKTLDCFCGYAYNACKKRIYVNHYKNKINSFRREV